MGIGKSRSEQIIFIDCGSAVTSETRFIHADKPTEPFTVVLPRVNVSCIEAPSPPRGRGCDSELITLSYLFHHLELPFARMSNMM